MPIKVGDILSAVKGELLAGDEDEVVSAVCLDSRRLKEGDLFLPLVGPNFDGHQFINEVMSAGAGGFLTDRVNSDIKSVLPRANPALKVADTQQALSDLASLIRKRLTARVVGISGSAGKTSTKDILASITRESFKTVASERNENNEIGVPLTITKAQLDTEVLLVEMGMRGLGQIASLAAIAQPDIGVITNIGQAHIGLLETAQKIAQAKSELVQALPESGYAVLNADDKWLSYLLDKTKAGVVTFGLSREADYSATEIGFDDMANPSWRLVTRGKLGPKLRLPVPGRHNVANALAAIAVADILGVDERAIVSGLKKAKLSEMRLNVKQSSRGFTIIDDVYNANPVSVAEALEITAMIKARGKRLAVLGPMTELGQAAAQAHKEVGRKVAEFHIDKLVAVGDVTAAVVESAIENGLAEKDIQWFESKEAATKWLKSNLLPGDIVLIKGSRIAGLEYVVEELS